ncbi:hypothetical protein JIM95_003935 [Corynebacterium sp. CCM 8835]|uniref:Uncharacterized protein n=1 Tax=Corynebacterium antarcticum TaxID=2800405 RepID=A0ABS1FHQ3_9CORY|nr:hypothetical protein [Corynebacterium antarcticum]MCK7642073.1 hypothetical protein [Corynebacterium antarcticum]MCL0245298.1 hypothetical protein [Corynebacterium antarcticum]MCX7539153.1 hypothetical protein [Corynebacterium antarcticum]
MNVIMPVIAVVMMIVPVIMVTPAVVMIVSVIVIVVISAVVVVMPAMVMPAMVMIVPVVMPAVVVIPVVMIMSRCGGSIRLRRLFRWFSGFNRFGFRVHGILHHTLPGELLSTHECGGHQGKRQRGRKGDRQCPVSQVHDQLQDL